MSSLIRQRNKALLEWKNVMRSQIFAPWHHTAKSKPDPCWPTLSVTKKIAWNQGGRMFYLNGYLTPGCWEHRTVGHLEKTAWYRRGASKNDKGWWFLWGNHLHLLQWTRNIFRILEQDLKNSEKRSGYRAPKSRPRGFCKLCHTLFQFK